MPEKAVADAGFLKKLPKAELHLHIEGTLEPALMLELARRNKVKLRFSSVAEIERAYNFTDLQSFLDIYYEGAAVLKTERDFHDLAAAYLAKAAADGVKRAEIFFDPQTHTARGVPMEAVIGGLHAACAEAASKGVSASLILCFLRHLSPEDAEAALKQAEPLRDKIIGVGLDSSEKNRPPSLFRGVYARARALGLEAVAHAGEEGPPDYIRQALDELKVSRIDHGVRCVEDENLIARLAAEKIPLTVCPLSNIKLRVFDKLGDHNLKTLLGLGLRATINSDDPAYFGGYVLDNYAQTAKALSLTRKDAAKLARNSFEACFLPSAEKKKWIAEISALEAA
jgi:adenosine deaminase